MAFEIGKVAHGYEFLEKIQSTGSGITYRVRNQIADRLETLKVLSREIQKDRERVERFMREVKIHARLTHPHIAAFYNAFEIDGEIVMTVETLEGQSLAELMSAGPIPLMQALDYSKQTLEALGYAHANGVMHRNITPVSLVVGPGGNLKVSEFELAKSETDPRLTLTGMIMGPMPYIAPEQIKGAQRIDGRADIYSFGMVLYEVLTGRKPFDSESQFEVMQAHVNQLPDPLTRLNTELPPEVDDVIFKAIAKDPADRYQTAAEFGYALDTLLPARKEEAEAAAKAKRVFKRASSVPTPQPPPDPAVRAPEPARDWRSLDPRIVGLVLFFAITLIGLIFYFSVGR
jgi:serine/threonine-protein kinase